MLGAVWGVWHLPLFFIDDTSQAHIPLALFLLSVVAMSVLFATETGPVTPLFWAQFALPLVLIA